MNELELLGRFPTWAGEGRPVQLFSAFSISERYEISLYHARKLVKALRYAGLVQRVGNQYFLNNDGANIAYKLAEIRERMLVK